MCEELSTWRETRRLADALGLRIHRASLDARDAWHRLQPRMTRLGFALVASGTIGSGVKRELANVQIALRKLRDEVSER